MSGPVSVSELQTAIQGLSIPGLKRIYASADASAQNLQRDLPALLPDPAQWVGSSHSERRTFGGAMWLRTRVLNYTCLVAEVGVGRKPADHADKISALVDAIENAFCDFRHAQLVTVQSVDIGGVGIMDDASGGKFYGFPVSLTVVSTY